jgi:hypothetical protein
MRVQEIAVQDCSPEMFFIEQKVDNNFRYLVWNFKNVKTLLQTCVFDETLHFSHVFGRTLD